MDNDTRPRSVGDSQSSGYDTSSRRTLQSQENLERNKKGPCIYNIITFVVVIIIITLAIILTAEERKSSPAHKSCLDGWIGYLGKRFYFSENTTTWAASQNFCVSHAASLVVFNTTQELDFLKRYSDHSQYWIGLSRKPGQAWKWIDGTVYNGWLHFPSGKAYEFSLLYIPMIRGWGLKLWDLEKVPIYTRLGSALPVPIWLENGFAANQTRASQEVEKSQT